MSLDRLLRPQSIAVFGGREAANLIEQCDRMGFTGAIWPVHPYRDELAGHPCYRSVADLPAAPDAAFIGVNRHASIDIVGELAARSAGGAILYASGFAEAADDTAAGQDLQQQLVAAAGDMPILGPNCYGFINYLDRAPLWPDQHGGQPAARGVAIITQSSNLTISLTMQRRGLPLAYVVAVGNQAQTDLAAVAQALLADARVTAIGLHIEGIHDVAGFEAMAAQARRQRTPIVALKPGRSSQAQSVSLSHTASIAGSDAAAGAFLQRLGIARVQTPSELLATLMLLHVHGALPGCAIGSMSCSGGDAALVADAAQAHAVTLPVLTNEQTGRIAATLDDLVTISNPLDYHTFIWIDQPALENTFRAMASCDFDLLLLILDLPRTDRCDPADWLHSLRALMTIARERGARTAVMASLPENMPEARAQELVAAGVAPMADLNDTMAAIRAAACIGRAQQADLPAPLLPVSAAAATRRTLPEFAAKQRLAAYGIPIPMGELSTNAVQTADEIGYPVVVKISDSAHKTETGGVQLNLRDAKAVAAAAEKLGRPGQPLLVEHMVEDAVAELVVGVTRDPQFGLLLTIGAGGIWVEILGDSRSLLLPTTRAELRTALLSLRSAPVLAGYRSQPAGDVEATLDALLAVARFAADHAGQLLELDINPLLVGAAGQGVTAADALLVMEEAQT